MYDDNNRSYSDENAQNSEGNSVSDNSSYEPNFVVNDAEESRQENSYEQTSYEQGQYGQQQSQPYTYGQQQNTYNQYGYGQNAAGQNTYGRNQNTYDYSYSDHRSEQKAPKWQPDPVKYNTCKDQEPKAPKKKKRWLIPLIIVLAVMVICVAGAAIYGVNYLKTYMAQLETEQDATDSSDTEINIVDSSSSSTSGIMLTDVSSVVEAAMPSVVSITSRSLVSNSGSLWGYYFGNSSGSTQEVDSGIGSGTIVGKNDTELLILTSYHVVEDASSLYVTFCDDEAVDGYVKSSSEDYDIAVVAVPLEDISESTLSSISIATLCTEEASVGEGVIVIGDALGYGQSVTTGIVSAVNRQITVENRTISVIQTDAAINSGNSGGCVLNSSGQIIGISEAKINSDAVEGMCYAISISEYADLIQELLTTTTSSSATEETTSSGTTSSGQTAYLGIRGVDINSSTASTYNMVEGVYVASVTSGGGAEAAGVQEGDIIVALDGTETLTMSTLQTTLSTYSAGDTVTLTVMRSSGNGYSEVDLEVTLTSQIN